MAHSHGHSHSLSGPAPLGPLAAKVVVGLLIAIGGAVLAGAAWLWPSQQKADIPLPFQNAAGGAVTTEAGHVLSSSLATCGSPSTGRVLTAAPVPVPAHGDAGTCVQAFIAIDSGSSTRVVSLRTSAALLGTLASLLLVVDAPFLHAIAAHADGSTLLAEDNALGARAALHRASASWRDLVMPYEAARTRVQIGLACRTLGESDSAAMEFDAAQEAFDRLGATPDMVRLADLTEGSRPPAGVLTGRECEVLRLVAAGKTNREIGASLVLSEHTVARHLQNIFAKLGLSSRAAATAYAYEHHLV